MIQIWRKWRNRGLILQNSIKWRDGGMEDRMEGRMDFHI